MNKTQIKKTFKADLNCFMLWNWFLFSFTKSICESTYCDCSI